VWRWVAAADAAADTGGGRRGGSPPTRLGLGFGLRGLGLRGSGLLSPVSATLERGWGAGGKPGGGGRLRGGAVGGGHAAGRGRRLDKGDQGPGSRRRRGRRAVRESGGPTSKSGPRVLGANDHQPPARLARPLAAQQILGRQTQDVPCRRVRVAA
jgi:hypothetical protein